MTHIEQVPAYVVWPLRHSVLYPEHHFESVKIAEDDQGMHLALFAGNVLVSVISLFKTGAELQFRKFATAQEYQGKGYGSKLLRYVLEFARREDVTRVWCNARTNAAGFYEKFGFERTEITFNKNSFDYVIMELFIDLNEMIDNFRESTK